jgi:hypothetical protein
MLEIRAQPLTLAAACRGTHFKYISRIFLLWFGFVHRKGGFQLTVNQSPVIYWGLASDNLSQIPKPLSLC